MENCNICEKILEYRLGDEIVNIGDSFEHLSCHDGKIKFDLCNNLLSMLTDYTKHNYTEKQILKRLIKRLEKVKRQNGEKKC